MSIRRALCAAVLLVFASCTTELEHAGPYDPDSPVSLQARTSLSGRLSLEQSRDPREATVLVRYEGGQQQVTPDAEGNFLLEGIPPGRWTVTLEAPFFVTEQLSLTVTLGERIDLGTFDLRLVQSAVLGSLTVATPENGSAPSPGGALVNLTFTGSIGSPAVGAADATDSVAPQYSYSVVAQSDGTFGFEGIPAGLYSLSASKDNAGSAPLAVRVSGEPVLTVEPLELLPLTGDFSILTGAWTNQRTITLQLFGFNADEVQIGEDQGAGCTYPGGYVTYSFQATLTLSDQDGLHTVCVRYRDQAGRETADYRKTVTLDRAAPADIDVTFAEGSFTKSRLTTLRFTATGADRMRFAESIAALGTAAWQPFAATRSYTLPVSTDGVQTVYAEFSDLAGNTAGPAERAITLDQTIPSGSVSLNYGDPFTSSPFVIVSLNVTDATEVRLSEDQGFSDAVWGPFPASAERTFLLTPRNGEKTVYAQFRDAAGNVSETLSDSIQLDTTPVTYAYVNIPADVTSETTLTLQLGRGDPLVDQMMLSQTSDFSDGAGWESYVPFRPFTFTGADGTKRIYVKFRKSGTGAESSVVTDSYVLDRTPPDFASISLNAGAPYATTSQVTLSLSGSDATSGLQSLLLSENPALTGAVVEPYMLSKVISLSPGEGLRTVYARFGDRAGNFSAPVSASIVVDRTAPTISLFQAEDANGNPLMFSASSRVLLRMLAADAHPLQMQLSNGNTFAGSSWTPWQETVYWDVPLPTSPAGNLRTVWFKARDAAGHTVGPVSYTFTVDTLAPSGVTMSVAGAATKSRDVTVYFEPADATRIELSDTVGFQAPLSFAARSSTTYTLPAGDGVKYLYARFLDDAGNTSVTVSDQILLDTTPPRYADLTIADGAYTRLPSVTLLLTALDADVYQAAEGSCAGAWQPFTTSTAFAFTSPGEGLKTIALRYGDEAGNLSSCLKRTVTYDATPPEFTASPVVTVGTGASHVIDRAVPLTLAVTGATEMQVSENMAFVGAAWVPFNPTPTWNLSAGDGDKTIYARFRDAAGNVTITQSADVALDTVPPTFNAAVAPAVTSAVIVPITLTANGATAMRLSTAADFSDVSDWAPFAADATFYAGLTEGQRTIYIQLADPAGNESLVRSVEVLIDRTAPEPPTLSFTGGMYTRNETVTLQVIASDTTELQISQDPGFSGASWTSYASLKSVALLGGEGAKTVWVRARDAAGNVSTPPASATIVLDQTPPQITLHEIRDGAGTTITSTNQLRVYVALNVTDATPVTMQMSATGVFSASAVEPLQTLRAWDLAPPTNPLGDNRSIHVRLTDAAGNTIDAAPLPVLVDTIAPTSPSLAFASSLVSDATVKLNFGAFNADAIELSDDISFLLPSTFAMRADTDYTLPAGDGLKTVYARYLDLHGNATQIVAASTVLDTTEPQLAGFTIEQGAITNLSIINLSLSAIDAWEMQIAENACGGLWRPFESGYAHTFTSASEGLKQIRVRYRDRAGNPTACLPRQILVDRTAPIFTATPVVQINNGATTTTERTISMAFAVSGATEMIISEHPSFIEANWVPFAPTYSWALSPGFEEKTLYVKFRDAAGNETAERTDTVYLLPLTPAINASIIDGDYTRYTTVQVQVLASNAAFVMLGTQSDLSDGVWQAYEPVLPFTLSGSDGLKHVYVKIRDGYGNESNIVSDTITLDRVAPNVTLLEAQDSFGTPITYSQQTRYYIRMEVSDLSPVLVQYSPTNNFIGIIQEDFQPLRAWDAQPATDPDGEERSTYVRIVDRAGNVSYAGPVIVLVDNVGVTQEASRITISPSVVSDATVTVNLFSVTAEGAELAEDPLFTIPVQFSMRATTDYTFTPGDGLRTLYGRFFSGGSYEPTVTATVVLDTTPPQNVGFTVDEAPISPSTKIHIRSTTTGAYEMRIAEGTCGGAWVPFQPVYEYTFASGVNEMKTVAVQYRDHVNHQTLCITEDLMLDSSLANITGISPNRGGAGDVVTIYGTNIGQSVGVVAFDGVAAQILSWSDTEIRVIVPPTAPVGNTNVVVSVEGVPSPAFPFLVEPGIVSVLPPAGPVGIEVKLVGGGFGDSQGGSTLTIGGITPTINLWSMTEIRFVVPAGIGGKTQLIELTVDGIAGSPETFVVIPNISGMTPVSGGTGTVITLTGTNFGFNQGTSRVLIGGFPAIIDSWSNTQVVVRVPEGVISGVIPVMVQVSGLTSSPVYFEHTQPWIDHRYPRAGTANTVLWLVGDYFGAVSGTVAVGNADATVLSWTDALVSVRIPAVLPAGGNPVTLTTATAITSNTVPFLVRGNDMWVPDDRPEPRTTEGVWTGKELLLWGGSILGVGYQGTGYRYNPLTDSWLPMSNVGAPEGRQYHTIVWTGKEAIVWGGQGAMYYGNGARYNPTTDTWTPVSTTDAPVGRRRHTAVWTGEEMIVWGGEDPSYRSDGARYNPQTDTWTPVAQAPLYARSLHSAVWTASEMIIWGGVIGTSLSDGARYNPRTDSWSAMSEFGRPQHRYNHSAVWTGTEMIIWGGYSDDAPWDLQSGGRYNPVNDRWLPTSITGVPSPRSEHRAIWTGTEMIIWGGVNWDFWTFDPIGGRYDPVADTWTPTSGFSAPRGRTNPVVVWTGTEMLIWGGTDEDYDFHPHEGGRYSPATDTWLQTGPLFSSPPPGVKYNKVVWTGSEMISWGGYDDQYWDYVNTGSIYNPAMDTWRPTSLTDAPAGREGHTAIWTGTHMIVWGGWIDSGRTDTGGMYDPALDTWFPTALTNAPSPRTGHTAVWTGDQMIIWGGWACPPGFSCNETVTGSRYYPQDNTWDTVSTTGVFYPRQNHTAVWTGTHMIVWGGYDSGNELDQGYAYENTTDTWTAISNSPLDDRYRHGAVWTGLGMAVWSGRGESYCCPSDGAIYYPNGNTWAVMSTTGAPSQIEYPVTLWTGEDILFWSGDVVGIAPKKYNVQTDTWIPLSTVNQPIYPAYGDAVWTGEEMLTFGGYNWYGGQSTVGMYIP